MIKKLYNGDKYVGAYEIKKVYEKYEKGKDIQTDQSLFNCIRPNFKIKYL